jgi:tetratricopeptide (TPR) repeat protein
VEASRKEYDKAAADFQTVIKKNPKDAAGYLLMGRLSLAQGHVPEGKAMYEKALEADPNSLGALGTLVDFDIQAKQPEKALARVQTQIAKSPSNAGLYEELAYVQLKTKDLNGALASSKKAMELGPSNFQAVRLYTKVEMDLDQVDPAITAWEQWLAKNPKDSRALSILGSLEEAKGEKSKAMDYYNKALQADPGNAVASNDLAYLMVEDGQSVDVALTLAQTARRAMPDSPQTADTLAWVNYYKGNYLEARDLLEEALKTAPDDASIQFHLGMTCTKLNDKTNAVLHLKKAIAIAPDGKAAKDADIELRKLQ